MSRTQKDSNQTKNTVVEVVKKNDGTLDLFLNRELDSQKHSGSLAAGAALCALRILREEYDSILREVNQNGRATIVF